MYSTIFLSQNEVAELKNCSLVEMASIILINAKLPKQFWEEAIMCATYLTKSFANKNSDEKSLRAVK